VEEIASKFASADLQNFCWLASKKSAVSAGFSGLRGNTDRKVPEFYQNSSSLHHNF